jgi:hypothetical protein
MNATRYPASEPKTEETLGEVELTSGKRVSFLRVHFADRAAFVIRTRMRDGRMFDQKLPAKHAGDLSRAIEKFQRLEHEDRTSRAHARASGDDQ